MSILLIILLCFMISGLLWVIIMVPQIMDGFDDSCRKTIIASIICISIFIIGIFAGIGFNTENEKVYVQKYLVQKQTIEMSLQNEDLTGFERIELVRQATELNGEVAERKARFQLWHFVVYDNTIYDNVELIKLTKGE